ncbi:MAG: hypothetical protein LBT78_12410, partial [Tannerella sp.]|nr:hypothetical protein [Tannerella sp.]
IPASGVSDKSLSGKIKIPLNAFSVYSDLQSECVEYKDLQSDFVRITNPAGRETAVANETNP